MRRKKNDQCFRGKEQHVFNQEVSGTVCCKIIWKYKYLENSQGRLLRTLFRGGAERSHWVG